MKYERIADIYSTNESIHSDFVAVVEKIDGSDATVVPDGEKWSLQQIVEHVAIVQDGSARICAKLVGDARKEEKRSDGSFKFSETFGAMAGEIAGRKLEAPERVQPSGQVPISDSLGKMAHVGTKMDELRSDLESYEMSGHTFPHPYFGPLTAPEWMALAGMHERRHLEQINRVAAKIKK